MLKSVRFGASLQSVTATHAGRLSIFCVGSLVLYGRVLDAYFLSDDFGLIGYAAEKGFYLGWAGFLRPLVVLSYVIDFRLFGLEPGGYHLTNVLLHGANSYLLYVFSDQLYQALGIPIEDRRVASGCASGMFLVLPCHSESVSWISGRTDLLAACFMMLSLIAWLSHRRTARLSFLCESLVGFALALLAKESAVVFPFVLFLFALVLPKPRNAEPWMLRGGVTLSGFFLVEVAWVLLRHLWLGEWVGGYGAGSHLGLPKTDWSEVARLNAFFIRAWTPVLGDVAASALANHPRRTLIVILVILGAVAVAIWSRGSWSPLGPSCAGFLGAFWVSLPILGTIPISLSDTQGERFLYFPTMFTSMLAACVVLCVTRSRRVAIATCVFAGLAWAMSLYIVNENWRAASGISWEISRMLAAESAGQKMVVVSVPDNFRGAYVFRNGLQEAVTTFQGGKVRELALVTTHSQLTRADGVRMRLRGSASYEVEVENVGTRFVTWADTEMTRVEVNSPRTATVTLKVPAENVDLFYFGGGAVKRFVQARSGGGQAIQPLPQVWAAVRPGGRMKRPQ